MRRTVAILGLVSGIAAAPVVRAGDELISPTPQPEKSSTPSDANDFGWQVMLADLAGLGATLALASRADSKAVLLPYLLAAPTVHAVHGDGLGAGASLFLNVAGPVGLGYLGYRLDSRRCGPDEEGCVGLGIVVGVLTGFGLAWALDSTYLSHPDRAASGPKIQVTPAVDPNRMFSLVVTGRF
jgi:hypothetical protein